jgi:hypothetical protein
MLSPAPVFGRKRFRLDRPSVGRVRPATLAFDVLSCPVAFRLSRVATRAQMCRPLTMSLRRTWCSRVPLCRRWGMFEQVEVMGKAALVPNPCECPISVRMSMSKCQKATVWHLQSCARR